jgi:hypothetical protein
MYDSVNAMECLTPAPVILAEISLDQNKLQQRCARKAIRIRRSIKCHNAFAPRGQRKSLN